MSVKYFDHFRFTVADLLTAYRQVTSIRPEIHRLALDHAANLIARDAVRAIDKAAVAGDTLPRSAFSNESRRLIDRRRKILGTGARDPEADFEFQVFLFPFRDRIYGRVFTEQHSWVSAVAGRSWVEDFSFWDHTDRPDGIPAGEWDVRGTTWRMIYAQDPSNSPAGAGLSADMTISLYDMPDTAAIRARIPSLEARALYQAHWRLLDGICQPRLDAVDEPSMSKIMQVYQEAEEWSRTEEGVAAHTAEAARVQPLLPDILAMLDD